MDIKISRLIFHFGKWYRHYLRQDTVVLKMIIAPVSQAFEEGALDIEEVDLLA